MTTLEYERPARKPINPALALICLVMATLGLLYSLLNLLPAWRALSALLTEWFLVGWHGEYFTVRLLQNELVIGALLVAIAAITFLVSLLRR